ncbi:MAG: hypothetical protein ACLR0U_17935 [Enterocloster clostridioformis]
MGGPADCREIRLRLRRLHDLIKGSRRGTSGESAAGEAGEKPMQGRQSVSSARRDRYQMPLKRIWMILSGKPALKVNLELCGRASFG